MVEKEAAPSADGTRAGGEHAGSLVALHEGTLYGFPEALHDADWSVLSGIVGKVVLELPLCRKNGGFAVPIARRSSSSK